MTKKKPTEGFFFRNVGFDAFDCCASLQSRYFQASIPIDDDAIRCHYQGKEKCVFTHFEQRIQPGCGNFDAESRITRVWPEVTHQAGDKSVSRMCDGGGTMEGNALAILLISWFRIRRDTSAIFRELRFSHAQRLASSRVALETWLQKKTGHSLAKGNGQASISGHTDLMCAVNVPCRHNWPSTFGYFCNPGDTFRASVFCGQAVDLNGRPGPIRTGDPLLRRQMLYPTELRARAFILSAQ